MIEQKVVHSKLRLFLTYYKIANPPKVKSINRKKCYTWLETVFEACVSHEICQNPITQIGFCYRLPFRKGEFWCRTFLNLLKTKLLKATDNDVSCFEIRHLIYSHFLLDYVHFRLFSNCYAHALKRIWMYTFGPWHSKYIVIRKCKIVPKTPFLFFHLFTESVVIYYPIFS